MNRRGNSMQMEQKRIRATYLPEQPNYKVIIKNGKPITEGTFKRHLGTRYYNELFALNKGHGYYGGFSVSDKSFGATNGTKFYTYKGEDVDFTVMVYMGQMFVFA